MYIDISKPPAPLPTPQLSTIAEGIYLLPPLSRRGTGPGIIILTPNLADNVEIKQGVPSPLRKWAEEGYTVAEIQESALTSSNDALRQAVSALKDCHACTPAGNIGLVAYTSKLWSLASSAVESNGDIMAAVVYADASEHSIIKSSKLPLQLHVSGKLEKTTRTSELIVYDYPKQKSTFAIPFQDDFDYAAEAVSHTRNLTFLKNFMNAPIFDLEAIWDEHTYFEFENRSVPHTMATMVDEPYVNHVPTITGGIGREKLTSFYSDHFVFSNAEDTELELISRTVGIDRIVDEFIFKFTHNLEVDWLIPGIPPTGKYLQIPFTAIVNIRGDRLYHEHIAWDQGTVLVQLGLMPEFLPFPYALPEGRKAAEGKKIEFRVPVTGVETAEKMRDKNSVPSNEMFEYGIREV